MGGLSIVSNRLVSLRIMRRWFKRLACLALVVGVLLVCLAPQWILPSAARFLDVSEKFRRVDYILVLNGDPEARPFAAAALVKAGLAKNVLLARQRLALESASVQQGAMLSELEITRRVLEIRGVSKQAIQVLPGEITSTADEARVLTAFLETRPAATVAVVTNAFHTRRARMVFRRFLGENVARVSFVGIPRDGADPVSWWRNAHGCSIYLSEYCKLFYYWLRY